MLHNGGSLADFERRIGPLARVEAEWYDYFRATVARGGAAVTAAGADGGR